MPLVSFFFFKSTLSPSFSSFIWILFFSSLGLLALTVGCGHNAREIFEECGRILEESLSSGSDASKISSVSRIVEILLGLVCMSSTYPYWFLIRFFHWGISSWFHLCLQLVECLAIITFVGGTDQEETEKSMDIIWRLINPKLGSNVGIHLKYKFEYFVGFCSLVSFIFWSTIACGLVGLALKCNMYLMMNKMFYFHIAVANFSF